MEKVYCRRCQSEATKSAVDGYAYSCPNCYEDLYTFEVEKKSAEKPCLDNPDMVSVSTLKKGGNENDNDKANQNRVLGGS